MNDTTAPREPNARPKQLDRAAAGRLMRLATYAAVGTASTLIAVKFVAWLMTDSVSLLSTLIDSLLDVAASTVNLLAVRHALEPADEEHRFGHGKAESLAGLAQSAFIGGSAVFLLLQAGERLFNPSPVHNTTIGYGVMVFSIVATIALVMFQKYVAKRTESLAISADSAHYTMDVLVNLSVIVSLYLASEMGWQIADPLFAIAISFYILHGAYEIGIEAYHVLMDRELPDEDREKIRALAMKHPQVISMHDLRTRQSGPDMFIQMHLEMKGEIPLVEAHEVAEDVMYRVQAAYPRAEVLIHQDPAGIEEDHAFED
ncbi:cation diffusion facilitator family transporter [Magnetovibrio sp.]|uniref:cation diffusion facilitator family transporter n=1 Tax=Magnetovibrio sp. TaxID=2024836 RepID=UPI002F93324E